MVEITTAHPGTFLLDYFLNPLRISSRKLAIDLKLSNQTISNIVNGSTSISPPIALRLARYFDTTPEYWLEMQMQYDLEQAKEKWTERIEREILPLSTQSSAWKPPEVAKKARERIEYKNPKIEELKKEIENLSGEKKKVFHKVGREPLLFDTIVRELSIEAGAVSAALTFLELDGLVKRLPGELYMRMPGLESI